MHNRTSLILDLRPSRFLLISGGIGYLLAGVAVVVSTVPFWVKAGFIAGITLAMVRFGGQYGYRQGRGFMSRIELLDGRWRIETGDGTICHARLSSGYAHPNIVILNFRLETGGRRSLVLLPDAADAGMLRRLRVWLRTRTGIDEPNQL